ncbi:MAG: MBL fold metallo-hydrolase [Bacteroidia bacterium]|nr:MBL fold metallo-hydrolase [Bacteroidia bacterium]
MEIKQFTFNPYQENTYVISDQNGNCAIIDPGCYTQEEQAQLRDYITSSGLKPVYLLNTHGHIDHMLGNDFVKKTFDIPFLTHEKVIGELAAVPGYATMMGLSAMPSPDPDQLVDEGEVIKVGDLELEVYFTPGHSPGHISFYHRESKNLFSGDVLFQGSIGRVDLPGGSMEVLMESIFKKVVPLGDDVVVWPGHGPETSIGVEKQTNYFMLAYSQGSL